MFSTPGVAVCINQEWLPHVLGALEVLTIPEYWDVPEDIIPEAEKLMDLLAGDPGDCGTPPVTTWCASSDFVISDLADNWSPGEYDSRGASFYNAGEGYKLIGSYGVAGASQLCVIKFNSVDPIHITRLRICFACSPGSNIGGTTIAAGPHADPNDESGLNFVTGLAADFNGCEFSGDVDWTTTDMWVRVQADASSGGSATSAILVISQVNIYGDGSAPAGLTIC